MRTTIGVFVASLLSLAIGPTTALAGSIINIVDISGPGGTGVLHSAAGDDTFLSLDFTSVGPIEFTGTLSPSGTGYEHFNVRHDGAVARVTNNTPYHWAGFAVTVSKNAFVGINSTGDAFDFGVILDQSFSLSGGPGVAPGESFEFSYHLNANGPQVVTIVETPYAPSAPEPSTLALLAIGSLIVGGNLVRRRSRTRK